jgi:hypothetical protein
MEITINQIAEDFSKHRFEKTFPFITDNIQWNMVGGEVILGKEKVIETCEQSLSYLNTVTTNFTNFLLLNFENHIIVESIAEYIDQDKNISKIASCDIYKFEKGLLTEITSYCIELDKQK